MRKSPDVITMIFCLLLLILIIPFTPSDSEAYTLVDLKINLPKEVVCTTGCPSGKSGKLVVPGAGRMRITYSGSPLLDNQPFSIRFDFPGSANALLPGRATVDSNAKDRKNEIGQPFVWWWIQEFSADQKGMEVVCHLLPRDTYYTVTHAVYPAQDARLLVEWLGSNDDSTEQPPSTVDISGTWQHGPGGETWTFTPKGDGTFTAVEKGLGNAKGTATVKGNKVRIDYVTADGRVTGVYEVTVAADGKTASGTVKDSRPYSGSTSWTRISGGSQPPGQEPANVTTMTLQAGKRTAKPGETVTVPVYLIKGAGVADMNFNVVYNSKVAQAGSVSKGSLIPGSTLFEANPAVKNTVRIGLAGSKDFAGTGPIAQISFKAVGKAGDRTPLRPVVTTIGSASGGKPSIATIDGEVEIISAAPPPPPPQDNKGDCDGNGQVNAADALCALKMSVGLIPVNTKTDMDNDGNVTSTDARLILQKVVGK